MKTDRRTFMQAMAGAGAMAPAALAEAAAQVQNGRTRRVGLIGCGWYGKIDLIRLTQIAPVEVVSLCDVDSRMLSDAAERIMSSLRVAEQRGLVPNRQISQKRPRTYSDYRAMLREKDLDLVLIAPPDHWHALAMIEAARSGVDIYVQKPISRDVVEGQAMVAAARKYGRVVQVGTQRRSTPHIAEARERYVQSGALGKIALVEIYCYYHMRATENPPDTAPPPNLNYEMWTGPAPMRPYNALVHPRTWRAFMEYGNGIVGDMCVHMLDMTRCYLDLGWPTRISSSGGILVDKASKANISDTQTAVFEYPDVRVVWQHRSWGEANDPKHPWGATFYGDKGTLKVDVFGYDYTPAGGQTVHRDVTYEYEKYPEDRTEKDLERHVAPAIRYHLLNFLQAVDARGRPVADIEQGHISTASCILANNALQLGRTIEWDAARQQAVGDEEANALLRRQYRAPWVHPEVQKV